MTEEEKNQCIVCYEEPQDLYNYKHCTCKKTFICKECLENDMLTKRCPTCDKSFVEPSNPPQYREIYTKWIKPIETKINICLIKLFFYLYSHMYIPVTIDIVFTLCVIYTVWNYEMATNPYILDFVEENEICDVMKERIVTVNYVTMYIFTLIYVCKVAGLLFYQYNFPDAFYINTFLIRISTFYSELFLISFYSINSVKDKIMSSMVLDLLTFSLYLYFTYQQTVNAENRLLEQQKLKVNFERFFKIKND